MTTTRNEYGPAARMWPNKRYPTPPTDVGRVLDRLLRDMGLSQRKLGMRIGQDHTVISHILAGRRNPSWKTLMAISTELDLTEVEDQKLFWSAGYQRRHDRAAGFTQTVDMLRHPALRDLERMLNDTTISAGMRAYVERRITGLMRLLETHTPAAGGADRSEMEVA